jgi:DNA repair protein SbcD/Mre11
MVRFAHIADCHLGSWKQKPLQDLNFECFKQAIDRCISEKLDFVLIAGDLFDSAYPPIETLKDVFQIFKKLHDAKIPCFIIAGSHDYSVSGKTFLDVLERSGFCKNVENVEEKNGDLVLNPTIFGAFAIYGYPGRRAGLEVKDLRKVKFNDTPGLFKIFMLHTTMSQVKGDLPIDSVDEQDLPHADYYALGHIHIDFQYGNFVYPSPLFPNNFKELEDLKGGGFYIVETSDNPGYDKERKLTRVSLALKPVECFDIELTDTINATEKIMSEINQRNIEDSIVLLRVRGNLDTGKHSDIKFQEIEEITRQKGAYFFLKNTHDLKTKEVQIDIEVKDSENIEDATIEEYTKENPSEFNILIQDLMGAFSLEKIEDEKNIIFEDRLFSEAKKILNL